MNLQHYSFQIGKMAEIYQGRLTNVTFNLSSAFERKEDFNVSVEEPQPSPSAKSVTVESNDFIIVPNLVPSVTSPPRSSIGKPFCLPGFLIKMPMSIVKPFGVKYIRYKLTIAIHKLILQSHGFGSQSVITLEQIEDIPLTLNELEAKEVNEDLSSYMRRINQAFARAIFGHKQAIDQWQDDINMTTPINNGWH
jgi:hypothetical protein